MSGWREDELEKALLEAKARIESMVALHRDRSSQEQLITVVDNAYDVVLETAGGLVKEARTSIDIIHARRPSRMDRLQRRGDQVERGLLYGAQEGVTIRLLTTPTLLDDDFVREQLGRERPVAIRVAHMPPLQALIVDDSVALVVAESAAGRRTSVIRVAELLHSLRMLFESIWKDAFRAGERFVFGDRTRAAFARRILRYLQAGVTDEVAARELTVSVRTYRRYVADIMSQLGGESPPPAWVFSPRPGVFSSPPGEEKKRPKPRS
ncbi:LuxR family transcriptional regulator, partial [Streptomyces malaysiensis]|uniref:LuxR family transcriptional regulator n=1 Tax=Streptomyces malaysiensis TaxID=92644 RepID=UPI00369B5C8C